VSNPESTRIHYVEVKMEDHELPIICSAEESIEAAGPEKPKNVLAAVHEERDKFKTLRERHALILEEHARELDRSTAGLHARLAFVYWAWGELLEHEVDLNRLFNDEFFQCSRQKPDKENLCRQLLYFVADARTEKERNRWSKPAKVLAHFRTDNVRHEDVVGLLKERGGVVKIFRSFSSDKAEHDGVEVDLDLLEPAPIDRAATVPTTVARSIALSPVLQHASEAAAECKELVPDDSNPDAEKSEHRDLDFTAAGAPNNAEGLIVQSRHGRAPAPPASIAEALKEHLLVKALDGTMELTLRRKYAAIFVKIGSINTEHNYAEVEALHIRQWDGLAPPDMISGRHGGHDAAKAGGVSPPPIDDEQTGTGSPTSIAPPPERDATLSVLAKPSQESERTLRLIDARTPAGDPGTGKPRPFVVQNEHTTPARRPQVETRKSPTLGR
jgi:hypothetical protein